MNALGNISLLAASLIYLSIINETILKNPPKGGDAGVGYAWFVVLAGALWALCIGVTTIALSTTGKLAWVHAEKGPRVLLILVGLACVIIGYIFLLFNENTSDLLPIVQSLFKGIRILYPAALIIVLGLLLNYPIGKISPYIFKPPIFLGIGVGVFTILIYLNFQRQRSIEVMDAQVKFVDSQHQQNLDQIAKTDVMKDLVFILVYTDRNHDKDVRESAVSKIKTRPDWQEELIVKLQNDWAPEVFTFLASNEVDDKALFYEPLRNGILIQSKLIKDDIKASRDVYDLYEGRFYSEVEKVLRTVDKFQDESHSYKNEISIMLKALQTPTDFKKPEITPIKLVEKWLKNN